VDADHSSDGDQEDQEDNDNGGVTDPAKVRRPIISLVDPALAAAWKVNQKHSMCFILDAVSPVRRFKWGMAFDGNAGFPEDTCDGNITETDGPDLGWMPVDPEIVGCV